jgi:acyl-CoA synthetase (AMP-forming)/AMP-acid ligase II
VFHYHARTSREDDDAFTPAGKLASYKKPTGLVILAELPRNASGKVLKHELRARYGQP